VQLEDGIAYVAERGVALNDPGSSGSLAIVEQRNHIAVVQAAEVCPGECIFIEIDDEELVGGFAVGKTKDPISVQ
jgi:ferredoxin